MSGNLREMVKYFTYDSWLEIFIKIFTQVFSSFHVNVMAIRRIVAKQNHVYGLTHKVVTHSTQTHVCLMGLLYFWDYCWCFIRGAEDWFTKSPSRISPVKSNFLSQSPISLLLLGDLDLLRIRPVWMVRFFWK